MYIEGKSDGIAASLQRVINRTIGAPIALFYYLGVGFRNVLYQVGIYKSHRVGVKVVSIGNLSVGGTGKTPTAEMLIRKCLAKGIRPAYLSRGYGRKTKGFVLVDPQHQTPTTVGDEPMQVKLKFPDVPVAVCENRVAGARQLLESHSFDILILDDAFQHRRIHRDLDIVTLDATRPPWEDWLLPMGRLREPARNLRRANLVLVNKIIDPKQTSKFKRKLPKAQLAFSKLHTLELKPHNDAFPAYNTSELNQRPAVVFAGLANNLQFYYAVSGLGVVITRFYDFPDHHGYRKEDLKRIARRFKGLEDNDIFLHKPIIITTEKDYTRLRFQPWFLTPEFQALPIYVVEIELDIIKGADKLDRAIAKLVGQEHKSVPKIDVFKQPA